MRIDMSSASFSAKSHFQMPPLFEISPLGPPEVQGGPPGGGGSLEILNNLAHDWAFLNGGEDLNGGSVFSS